MATEEMAGAAETAARRAKQAAVLAMLAVAVALAVLAIDNGIKRAILDEAAKARKMLDDAAELVASRMGVVVTSVAAADKLKEAPSDAAEGAGPARAPDSPGDDGGDVLVDAPGASAAAGNHASAQPRTADGRFGGKAARARGDG